jgi:hypothetical protein
MYDIDTVGASLDALERPEIQAPTLVGDPMPVDADGFAEPIAAPLSEAPQKQVEPLSEEPQKPEPIDIMAKLAALQAMLEELKSEKPTPAAIPTVASTAGVTGIPKNKRAVKPEPGRTYVRLGPLDTFGRVPKQQADIAAILTESMDIGKPWTEEEVFELVTDGAVEYDSLAKSVQHATYLFTYYRGLKNDGKHAGLIARNFLRMVG